MRISLTVVFLAPPTKLHITVLVRHIQYYRSCTALYKCTACPAKQKLLLSAVFKLNIPHIVILQLLQFPSILLLHLLCYNFDLLQFANNFVILHFFCLVRHYSQKMSQSPFLWN